jgi:NAD(P)-dependent dehydrogenase (short-subunit alcohol dehydrogenase family)
VTNVSGKVALITGGANGIGRAVAHRLAASGAHVVVADIDREHGRPVADRLAGAFVSCDVRNLEDIEAAVALAVDRFGGLDIAFLNAGVASTTVGVGADFDLGAYRRTMAVNVDGVFFGVHAALPALIERGGGAIVLTASLAGLTAVPLDPVYCASKHAVVGFMRALAPALAADNIAVNALCPGFADTAITIGIRELIAETGVPLLAVDEVVDAFVAILASGETGQAWYVQPGRPSEPFRFRNVPGARADDGTPVGGPLRLPGDIVLRVD